MAKLNRGKMLLALGMPDHSEPPEGDEPEGGESPAEQACKDIIDCLGVDPKNVDKPGLMAALKAFVHAEMAEREGPEEG